MVRGFSLVWSEGKPLNFMPHESKAAIAMQP
jgi:hypothetical protein